jgi:hypothetical protein
MTFYQMHVRAFLLDFEDYQRAASKRSKEHTDVPDGLVLFSHERMQLGFDGVRKLLWQTERAMLYQIDVQRMFSVLLSTFKY